MTESESHVQQPRGGDKGLEARVPGAEWGAQAGEEAGESPGSACCSAGFFHPTCGDGIQIQVLPAQPP